MHTNLEQGHKNIITNMLCLGMYLGLLEYTDMVHDPGSHNYAVFMSYTCIIFYHKLK